MARPTPEAASGPGPGESPVRSSSEPPVAPMAPERVEELRRRVLDEACQTAFQSQAVQDGLALAGVKNALRGAADDDAQRVLTKRSEADLDALRKRPPPAWDRFIEVERAERARLGKFLEDQLKELSEIESRFASRFRLSFGGYVRLFPWGEVTIPRLRIGFHAQAGALDDLATLEAATRGGDVLRLVRDLDLGAEYVAATNAAWQYVVDALVPQVAAVFGRRLTEWSTPTYQTWLDLNAERSLSSLAPQWSDVSTLPLHQVQAHLETLDCAAIGIAGPRGSGKTTLLRRCANLGAEHGSVFVSAPVAYDSREFILHLFAQVCLALGATDHESHVYSDPPAPPAQRAGQLVDDARRHWRGWVASRGVGLSLIAVGVVLAVDGLDRSRSEDLRSLAIAALIASVAMAVAMVVHFRLALLGSDERVGERRRRITSGTVALGMLLSALVLWLTSRHPHAVDNAELGGQLAIAWGAVILAAAGLMLADEHAVRRQILDRSRDQHATRDEILRSMQRGDLAEEGVAPLADLRLREIRYQQTYSWGSQGTLSLNTLVGVEYAENASQERAPRPKTLPDIIHDLHELLGYAGRLDGGTAKVVIAIDELDKLESPESAAQFVNDIKAVFGVPGVYFLVSVSEDAMAGFERRGLPFRNDFDSAFDEIVHVDFSGIEEARLLLGSRVVGMPMPFVTLCHVVGGGLPRDMLRVARDLYALSPDTLARSPSPPDVQGSHGGAGEHTHSLENDTHPPAVSLNRAVTAIVRDELLRRLPAIRASLHDPREPAPPALAFAVEGILDELHRNGAPDRDALADVVKAGCGSPLPAAPNPADLEMAALLYFSWAVLIAFGDRGFVQRCRDSYDNHDSADSRSFERLAGAHQGFAVHPLVAWHRVSGFLEANELPSLPSPSAPSAATPGYPSDVGTLAQRS